MMRTADQPHSWDSPEFADDLAFEIEDDFAFGAGDLETGPEEDFDFSDAPLDPAPYVPPAAHVAALPVQNGDQPIPRIRIHGACDRAEVARVIQQTSEDRRMTKVELSVELGGVEAACVRFAAAPSPNLLIVDCAAPPQQLLQKLDRLAEVCEEGTKVVVIGVANDIALFRELMRRGVSEYMVAPVTPLQLTQTIASLYVDPSKPFAGRMVAVVGAKGGVGASTIAHNLAWAMAERCQANTTLVDLDLSFGTTALDFNHEPQQTIADALLSPERVDEVLLDRLLTKHTDRLMLFSAPANLDREYEIDPSAYETVIDRVRRTAPFVVLDLPHAWSPWMRQTLVAADDIVLVATPELASLRNAKQLIDRVKKARPNDSPPVLVINMASVPKRPEIPIKDFGEAVGLEPTFIVPFEPQVFGMAANNGQMVCEMAAQSKSAIALEGLAVAVCGREPPPKRKAASLLDRLPILKR